MQTNWSRTSISNAYARLECFHYFSLLSQELKATYLLGLNPNSFGRSLLKCFRQNSLL